MTTYATTQATPSTAQRDYTRLEEHIPQLLRDQSCWLTWQLQTRSDTPTKVPDQSTRDVQRCRAFRVVQQVPRTSNGGLGFVLTGGLVFKLSDHGRARLLAIDLDACRHPDTGIVEPWAISVVERLLFTTTEVSPSGTGLRVFVLVRNVSLDIKSHVRVPDPAPRGIHKSPQLQLFGLGPAGYVTVTGMHLAATSKEPQVVADIDWLVELLHLQPDPRAAIRSESTLPRVQLDDITKKVLQHSKGEALIDARWKEVTPNASASDAYHLLAERALDGANGHVDLAVAWLLTRTEWGKGNVDDSRQPDKYARESWVFEDVKRCRVKRPPVQELFEVVEPAPEPPLAPADNEERPAADALVDFAARFAAVRSQQDDGTLVHGLLARGRITNIAAGPKTGKSTLLQAALVGFTLHAPRPFPGFGAPAKPLRVLYLSENHPDDDAVTLTAFAGPQTLEPGDGVLRLLDRRRIPPDARSTWRSFLKWVAALLKAERFDAVVFDSFEAWIPDLDSGNEGAQIAQRYADLTAIIAQPFDVAVVCVLHVKKAGGPTLDFDAMLGSTKFRASSDFNLMLVRHAPDNLSDTRVVLRREGRDPWGLVKRVCGRLPADAPTRVRDREHCSTTLLCYQLAGEIVAGADGHELPSMRYEQVAVPAEWQRAPRPAGSVKLTAAEIRQLDEQVLLLACRLHAAEHGARPVSPRRLVGLGFADRAAQQLEVPHAFTALTPDRARSAGERLVGAGKLEQHGKDGRQGVTPIEQTDRFPPAAAEEAAP